MPNKLSAERHIRADGRKHDRNVKMRSEMRTALKKAELALQVKSDDAAELVKAAASLLDKTAQKHAISKGLANRKKSTLAKKLNKMDQVEAA